MRNWAWVTALLVLALAVGPVASQGGGGSGAIRVAMLPGGVADEALFNPTDTERQVRLLKRRVLARFTWQRAYGEYLPLWVGTTQ